MMLEIVSLPAPATGTFEAGGGGRDSAAFAAVFGEALEGQDPLAERKPSGEREGPSWPTVAVVWAPGPWRMESERLGDDWEAAEAVAPPDGEEETSPVPSVGSSPAPMECGVSLSPAPAPAPVPGATADGAEIGAEEPGLVARFTSDGKGRGRPVAGNEDAPDQGSRGDREAPEAAAFPPRSERLWGHWLKARSGGAEAEVSAGAGIADAEVGRADADSPAPAKVAEGRLVGGTEAPKPEGGAVEPRGGVLSGVDGPAPRATEAVAAGGRPAAVPHPPPATQVARGVRLAIARGGDRVTVQLSPAHLGKVHLVLTREDGGLSAHFRVETPQAQQALAGELPLLRQALEARGLPVVQAWVDLADGREREGPWDGPGRRPRRGAKGPVETDVPVDALAAAGPWRTWGFDARA